MPFPQVHAIGWWHGLGEEGCLAQLVERRPYKANVSGSIPLAPTKEKPDLEW